LRWSASFLRAGPGRLPPGLIDYLNGKLQFLFIAHERLRVNGFQENAGEAQTNPDRHR